MSVKGRSYVLGLRSVRVIEAGKERDSTSLAINQRWETTDPGLESIPTIVSTVNPPVQSEEFRLAVLFSRNPRSGYKSRNRCAWRSKRSRDLSG